MTSCKRGLVSLPSLTWHFYMQMPSSSKFQVSVKKHPFLSFSISLENQHNTLNYNEVTANLLAFESNESVIKIFFVFNSIACCLPRPVSFDFFGCSPYKALLEMIAGDEIKLLVAAAPQEQPNILHPVMSKDKAERQQVCCNQQNG